MATKQNDAHLIVRIVRDRQIKLHSRSNLEDDDSWWLSPQQ